MHTLLLSIVLLSNPFRINYPEVKEQLSEEQYVDVQKKLQTIDLVPTLDKLYPKTVEDKKSLRKREDFYGRISRGIGQVFSDPENKKKPIQKLFKINKGGEYCIVSYASYNGVYDKYLQAIPKALEKSGFNGYFLSLMGAFPNPTGKEIQYAGVPYSFKIFSILEAQKLGFSKVLWIDASFLPLRDPTPLFQWIDGSGCFLHPIKNNKRYLLPATRDILLESTGCDMYKTLSVRGRMIGLDLRTEKAKKLIEDFYALVEMGTPFISCFPEEFVLGALIGKNPADWPAQPFDHCVMNEKKLHGKKLSWARNQGYFFLLQQH